MVPATEAMFAFEITLRQVVPGVHTHTLCQRFGPVQIDIKLQQVRWVVKFGRHLAVHGLSALHAHAMRAIGQATVQVLKSRP